METTKSENAQSTSWWITSLAISVTCCAILFVIFAGFLADVHKSLKEENVRLEMMSQRQTELLAELQLLRHTITEAQAASVAMAPAAGTTPPAGTVAAPAATAQTPAATPASSPVSASAPASPAAAVVVPTMVPSTVTPGAVATPAAPAVAPVPAAPTAPAKP